MPNYQIFDGGKPALRATDGGQALLTFDDGLWELPGEYGYDDSAVAKFVASLGSGYSWQPMGRSAGVQDPAAVAAQLATQAAAQLDQERATAAQAAQLDQARAAAMQGVTDRLLQLHDPAAHAEMMRQREINARYDAEVGRALELGLDAGAIAGIEELRSAELNPLPAIIEVPA